MKATAARVRGHFCGYCDELDAPSSVLLTSFCSVLRHLSMFCSSKPFLSPSTLQRFHQRILRSEYGEHTLPSVMMMVSSGFSIRVFDSTNGFRILFCSCVPIMVTPP